MLNLTKIIDCLFHLYYDLNVWEITIHTLTVISKGVFNQNPLKWSRDAPHFLYPNKTKGLRVSNNHLGENLGEKVSEKW